VVGLVLLGFGYWGIVVAEVVATVIFVTILGLVRPVIVRLRWDKSAARELFHFGSPIAGSSLLVFLLFNADNFAIGSVVGATALGYYVVAFNWGSLICSILSETVNGVLLPAFAKMQDDLDAMRRLYLRSVASVGFIGVLANTCLLAVGHEFLVVVLGRGTEKWLPALTCLHVLAVYGMIRALTEPLANVAIAVGKTKVLLTANAVAAAIEIVPMLWILWKYGITGIAVLVTVAYLAQVLVYVPFLARELAVRGRDLLRIVVPLAVASGIAVFVGSVALGPSVEPSWFSFGARIIVTGGVFTLLHGLLTSFTVVRDAYALTTSVLANVARNSSVREGS
jgi:O-antigen/teichoic acid export membrane protein